ncbi:MAG: IreB family regulatory phosphoprotein [Lachnospiraceae bacterium]|nr:IreB family regulatory phosphoprotein [Lachnospiraceae bacterium]
MDKDVTQIIYTNDPNQEQKAIDVKEVLAKVYAALKEKGYNPTNQIVQYIMSGEPLFITSYNSARSIITKVERDELVEELVKSYIEQHFKELDK